MQVGPGCVAKEGFMGVRTSGFIPLVGMGWRIFEGCFLLRRPLAETHKDHFSHILKSDLGDTQKNFPLIFSRQSFFGAAVGTPW